MSAKPRKFDIARWNAAIHLPRKRESAERIYLSALISNNLTLF